MRTKFEEWMSLHRRTFKLLGITVSMHQQCDGRLSGLLHSNDHEMAIWRHASASAIWTFAMFQLNNSKFSQACRVVRAKIEETLGILSNYGAKELGHIYVQLFTTATNIRLPTSWSKRNYEPINNETINPKRWSCLTSTTHSWKSQEKTLNWAISVHQVKCMKK